MTSNETKQTAEDLLPWYVSGALSPEEAALVDHALERDAELRVELSRLENLRATVRDDSAALETPPASDVDRVLSRIEAHERTAAIERQQKRDSWFAWLGSLGGLFSPAAMRVGMALAIAVIAIETTAIVGWMGGADTDATYEAATGADPADAGHRILVRFAAGASVTDMNGLLWEVGGRIVSGPSADGAYVISVDPGDDGQDVAALVADLAKRTDLVEFAAEAP